MSRKDELIATIERLRDELSEITEAERREAVSALAGRCFRYRNSYGRDTDPWWLYGIIQPVSGDGDVSMFQFEWTSEEKVKVQTAPVYFLDFLTHWQEITRTEFDAAWLRLLERLARLHEVTSALPEV